MKSFKSPLILLMLIILSIIGCKKDIEYIGSSLEKIADGLSEPTLENLEN
jgi:hypothetical protein